MITKTQISNEKALNREKYIIDLMKVATSDSLKEELTRLYFINRLNLIETKN
jgi:hypothetical protein